MKKHERIIWILVVVFLCGLFVSVNFLPEAEAASDPYETNAYLQSFEQVFRFVKNNYVDEIDSKKLYEGALKGLFESLDDPHSFYLTEDDMKDMNDTTTGKFGGVGLFISKSRLPGNEAGSSAPAFVEVIAPIEGTPAYAAGLLPGDYIIKIKDESTEKLTIDEVVERLRGTPGTEIEITIMRNKTIVFPVTLKRAMIEVPTVKSAMIDKNTAYLKIIQFTPYTAERVEEALKNFAAKNYKYLVIDLSNNPGGLLQSVIQISDFFLPSGTIVSTRSRIPSENAVYNAGSSTLVPKNIPIAVIINKGSASASEILAGALKDHKRAYVIGETSFGKGSVQQVRGLGNSGFKLTMSRYYTPSGINIDKIGIEPDKTVKEKELTEAEAESLKKLLEGNYINEFAGAGQTPSEKQITEFISGLQKKGIILEERLLRKFIRDRVNRSKTEPPVYDLEYDLALKEAIRMLQAGEILPGK
jgi:carboxyl-terminal processing protease